MLRRLPSAPDGIPGGCTRTAVNPRELPFPVQSEEPLYLVVATPAKQAITTYGREERLQAGGRLLAEIYVERRKLWEWILGPLFTLRHEID